MNCKQYQNNIDAYCEGTIGENLRTLMETHRNECPVCARFTHAYELVFSSLKTAKQVPPPLALRGRILAIPDEEKILEKIYPFPWASLITELGAIAGVYIAGIILFIGTLSHDFMNLSGIFGELTERFLQLDSKTYSIFGRIDLLKIKEQWVSIINKIVYLSFDLTHLPYTTFSTHLFYFIFIVALIPIIWFYFDSVSLPLTAMYKRPKK